MSWVVPHATAFTLSGRPRLSTKGVPVHPLSGSTGLTDVQTICIYGPLSDTTGLNITCIRAANVPFATAFTFDGRPRLTTKGVPVHPLCDLTGLDFRIIDLMSFRVGWCSRPWLAGRTAFTLSDRTWLITNGVTCNNLF
jgi:hypothetical protein